ncbi:MAG: hypothetical protein KKH04_17885 [Proteobacteria bacterium]|nr:hypothetical protein [Pseudomonadota bacterium]
MSKEYIVEQKKLDLDKINKIEKEKAKRQKEKDQDRIDQIEKEKEDKRQPSHSAEEK